MNNWGEQFPALMRHPHGKRLAYLDSASSAQKPIPVLQNIHATLNGAYANIHRGLYYNSAVTTAAFEEARKTVASFLGAAEHGLVFTRNATESVNLVAQTWGRKNLTKNDTVVLTEIEHHANIVPWQILQAEIGFTIRVVPHTVVTAPFDQSAWEPLLNGAKLLCITQKSNVTGVRPPLESIIPLADALGLATMVDGAQGAAHMPQNLTELGCTFYACTGHKLYGPTGIGVLWGKPQVMESLPPYQGGGDMIEEVALPTGTTYAHIPARFEAGTPAIAEAIALATAITFIKSLGWPAIELHEKTIAGQLTQALKNLPFVKLYSPADTGIASFNVGDAHPSDIATLLDQQGVAVRSGHHCAMPYMKALGIEGCVRASIGLYTTQADIAQLVDALQKAHEMLA